MPCNNGYGIQTIIWPGRKPDWYLSVVDTGIRDENGVRVCYRNHDQLAMMHTYRPINIAQRVVARRSGWDQV